MFSGLTLSRSRALPRLVLLLSLLLTPSLLLAQENAPTAPQSAAEELAQSVAAQAAPQTQVGQAHEQAQEQAPEQARNQTQAAPRGIPDAPNTAAGQPTPISVEHHGADNVGARLALQLKELFNRSSLFRLSTKDESKIKLILNTKVEFEGRPNSSSVYSAVWVYSESEGTLKYYLASETGVVDSAALEFAAELLTERSDNEASKYRYLFE